LVSGGVVGEREEWVVGEEEEIYLIKRQIFDYFPSNFRG
jgi:hypothetical protein